MAFGLFFLCDTCTKGLKSDASLHKGDTHMNKKECNEIKKLFTPANCAISRICGCYVDAEKNKKTEIRLARKEEMVYSCVDLKPKHLDEIIKLTDLELLEVQEILVKLELMELVTEPIKNYYARAGG